MIHEGIMIYMLLSTISDLEPNFKDRFKRNIKEKSKSKETSNLPKILGYFSEKTASIEIFNESKHIQKIYFPVENVTKFLSDYTKKGFEENVNRESANEKIKGLLTNYEDFYDEMNHFQMLNALGIKVNLTYFEILKNISLLCVMLINLILLYSQTGDGPNLAEGTSTTLFITILGLTIMIIYLVIRGTLAGFQLPNRHQKNNQKIV